MPRPALFLLLPLLCVVTLTCLGCGGESPASAATQEVAATPSSPAGDDQPSGAVQVRFLRLRIPDTSPITDKPGGLPDIFVQLYEDGVKVAESSTREGWSVEFPKRDRNVWTVRPGASYSLQVIDGDSAWLLNPDDRLFEIVGLTFEHFVSGEPIHENRGSLTPPDQCASLEFEVLP